MRAPWKKLASAVTLAASSACVTLLQVGCESDVERADTQVEYALAQATENKADPEAELKAAQDAVNVQNASSHAKVAANVRLAGIETARAQRLMREIEREETGIALLIAEINAATGRIRSNNTMALGFTEHNPEKLTETLESTRNAAAGEGGKPPVWYKHESGPVQALSGARKTVADLQGQIAKLDAAVADMTAQRTKALSEADRLERASEQASGKQSVDLFVQAAGQRKIATDMTAKMADTQADLEPLRTDLERAQATERLLVAAVKQFDASLQATQKQWQDVQARIDTLRASSKALLLGGPRPTTGVGESPAAPGDAPGGDGTTPPVEQGADAPQPEARSSGSLQGASGNDRIQLAQNTAPGAAPGATDPAGIGAGGAAPGGADAGGGAAPGDRRPATGKPSAELTAASVAQKAALLKKAVDATEAKRKEAERLLQEAVKHYATAQAEAEKISRDLTSRVSNQSNAGLPERRAWEGMLDLYEPGLFRVRQAALQLMIGSLNRDRAALLAARSEMIKSLGAAVNEANQIKGAAEDDAGQLTPPPVLKQLSDGADPAAARKEAAAAYDAADKLIKDVTDGPQNRDSAQRAAQAAKVLTLVSAYGRSQLVGEQNPADGQRALDELRRSTARPDSVIPIAELPAYLQEALAVRPAGAGATPAVPGTTPGTPPGTTPPGTTPPEATPPGTTPAPGDTTTTPPAAEPPGAPGAAQPDAGTTPPDATGTPGTAAPGTGAPGATTPGAGTPDAGAAPGTAAPDAAGTPDATGTPAGTGTPDPGGAAPAGTTPPAQYRPRIDCFGRRRGREPGSRPRRRRLL